MISVSPPSMGRHGDFRAVPAPVPWPFVAIEHVRAARRGRRCSRRGSMGLAHVCGRRRKKRTLSPLYRFARDRDRGVAAPKAWRKRAAPSRPGRLDLIAMNSVHGEGHPPGAFQPQFQRRSAMMMSAPCQRAVGKPTRWACRVRRTCADHARLPALAETNRPSGRPSLVMCPTEMNHLVWGLNLEERRGIGADGVAFRKRSWRRVGCAGAARSSLRAPAVAVCIAVMAAVGSPSTTRPRARRQAQ